MSAVPQIVSVRLARTIIHVCETDGNSISTSQLDEVPDANIRPRQPNADPGRNPGPQPPIDPDFFDTMRHVRDFGVCFVSRPACDGTRRRLDSREGDRPVRRPDIRRTCLNRRREREPVHDRNRRQGSISDLVLGPWEVQRQNLGKRFFRLGCIECPSLHKSGIGTITGGLAGRATANGGYGELATGRSCGGATPP